MVELGEDGVVNTGFVGHWINREFEGEWVCDVEVDAAKWESDTKRPHRRNAIPDKIGGQAIQLWRLAFVRWFRWAKCGWRTVISTAIPSTSLTPNALMMEPISRSGVGVAGTVVAATKEPIATKAVARAQRNFMVTKR
jgi:hypothetical protein